MRKEIQHNQLCPECGQHAMTVEMWVDNGEIKAARERCKACDRDFEYDPEVG